MATIFASMAKGKASQTTNPSLGGSSSSPPPITFTPPPTPIPTAQQSIPIDMFKVRSKKKARKKMILMKPYPTADRLIIFSLTTEPNDRKEAADRALQVANKTSTTHADIEHPPLILATITTTNNLVFTVAPQHLSTSYKPYLANLEEALHEFPIASSRVSQ